MQWGRLRLRVFVSCKYCNVPALHLYCTELFWIVLPLFSGALVPSLVCVYLPRMYPLYCQLHSLLTYTDRFDTLLLTLVSLLSLHVMYRYGTLIRLKSGSLTSCHVRSIYCCAHYQLWSAGSQLCMHPVCHYDSLFVSTRRRTSSTFPTHACTPVVLSPFLGIPWTCGTCLGCTGPFS